MKEISRGFELSTGRVLDPIGCIIGLCVTSDPTYRHELTSGSDESLRCRQGDDIREDDELSADEKREVANFMIAEWTKFKDEL